MKKRSSHYSSLSRRIILQFCIFTLTLSLVYSFITFVMMYTLEDRFIEKELQQEAQRLSANYNKTGLWPSPSSETFGLHFSKESFPEDIRQQAIASPNQFEFFGNGERHYHVITMPGYDTIYLVAEVSDSLYVRNIRNGIITFLFISGLFVSAIACTIAWFIGRSTARPLTHLADLVANVDAEKIPERFAHQYPNTEVGVLADTLEQTLHRLKKALEREKCFTRDASHELRSPLSIIKNAAELYLSTNKATPENTAIVSRIATAAEQMDKTVHTLLALAREECSNATKENTNLMSIVEQSILDHRTLLDGKHIEVILDDNLNTKVYLQSGMAKVLIDNLISNAFQYIQSGEVRVSFIEGSLVVADTGPGIEHAITDNLTEPTVKGSQSTGFGFGLSIVKRLCEHQGWQLEVNCEHGTTISVLLV
ncbi:sensor histidine kinase [Pseudoalteromonas sp. T1lg65]|uniref:sensor histidine kinase n=1 Tax=Pseudoalteromonas sp. T1lg65 TaxID=2077101 RepID=UPI003F7B12C7